MDMTDKTNQNISPLVFELKSLLESYLDKNKGTKLGRFGREIGVGASTLRRILNLETKEDPISSTVLGIVSAVFEETNIEKLISLTDGEIKKSLERSYGFVKESAKPCDYCPDLADVLNDRESYIVYKLAANHCGTSKKKLIDLLGMPAESKIEELMELGLIFEEEGLLHARKKNFVLPEKISKMYIPELIRLSSYRPKTVQKNIFRNMSESLSLEGYEEILEVQRAANEKIKKILNDENKRGTIPLFFVCIVDSLGE